MPGLVIVNVKRPTGSADLSEQEVACVRVALKRWLKAERGAGKRERRGAALALSKLAEPGDQRAQRLVEAVLGKG
jgi:hypothetical protein